jgi:hypothetical protein
MNVLQSLAGQSHPVVLRFAELFPAQLAAYQMHGDRSGGDLSHIDRDRSRLNRILIGPSDWREQALAEIDLMRHENLAEELETLKVRGRTKEFDARLREGLKDPWRPSKGGPLREVILTANKDWFEASDAPSMFGNPAAERELEFQMAAVDWLKRNFGDDVIHARADHDERTCHIHAIILPREVKDSKRRGRQRMLQPSVHPLIKAYEMAQDDAGAFFASVGLRRGDRSAEARRQARAAGSRPPDRREHVPPSRWREEEALRLSTETQRVEAERRSVAAEAERVERQRAQVEAERASLRAAEQRAAEREAEAAAREREADGVIAVAEAIETGVIAFDDQGKPRRGSGNATPPKGLVDRIEQGGVGSKRFLARLGVVYARLAESASNSAHARLGEEFERAREAIQAANALIRKVVMAMPMELRSRFRKDIKAEDSRLLNARDALDKIDRRSRESEIDGEEIE